MSVTISGFAELGKALERIRDEKIQKIAEVEKAAVTMLVDELMVNIPVWSGRTIEGIRVTTTGEVAPLQGTPSDTSAFGQTSKQALGSEPMRAVAEEKARAQVSAIDYVKAKNVYITIASEAWPLVELAEAPGATLARNKAVVSEIALEKVRNAFPDAFKT